jgi:acyl-CoA synthetase (AMP-forming)/AMP-acid ligase II
MPDSVLRRVNEHLPGRKVNIYGTTEAMNSLYAADPKTGGLRPGFYSEIRLARIGGSIEDAVSPGEEGELIVATNADATFCGYLNQPEVTATKLQHGWYRTSDVAVIHEDGEVEIRGRVDDMIISGGENIHPAEVERVLKRHPKVSEVVVLGLPDERWGQRVVACVVANDPTLSMHELDELCRESELADFKRPRSYAFLEEIPKNAMNKVLRKPLAKRAQSIMTSLGA